VNPKISGVLFNFVAKQINVFRFINDGLHLLMEAIKNWWCEGLKMRLLHPIRLCVQLIQSVKTHLEEATSQHGSKRGWTFACSEGACCKQVWNAMALGQKDSNWLWVATPTEWELRWLWAITADFSITDGVTTCTQTFAISPSAANPWQMNFWFFRATHFA